MVGVNVSYSVRSWWVRTVHEWWHYWRLKRPWCFLTIVHGTATQPAPLRSCWAARRRPDLAWAEGCGAAAAVAARSLSTIKIRVGSYLHRTHTDTHTHWRMRNTPQSTPHRIWHARSPVRPEILSGKHFSLASVAATATAAVGLGLLPRPRSVRRRYRKITPSSWPRSDKAILN